MVKGTGYGPICQRGHVTVEVFLKELFNPNFKFFYHLDTHDRILELDLEFCVTPKHKT